MTTKPIEIKREMVIVVTPQAQKVLSHTNYSIEDFVDWSLTENKFSLGGHNAMMFLEKRYKD